MFGLNANLLPLFQQKDAGWEVFNNLGEAIIELNDAHKKILQVSLNHQSKIISDFISKKPQQILEPNIGDLVLLSGGIKPPKLSTRFKGPYVVIETLGPHSYNVQHLATGKTELVHINRLHPYYIDGSTDPRDVASHDTEEWLVDSVVSHYFQGKKTLKNLLFVVRWFGFDDNHDSELPYSEIKELEALDVYLLKHPKLKSLCDKNRS